MDEIERDLRDDGEHKNKQPWWNDGDKVGGAAASILLIAVCIAVSLVIIGLALKFFIWIIPN
jgi:hypothetical protein